MRICYLVHDLDDPAVARRIGMFQAGGAEITLLGFYRGILAPESVAGIPTIVLGRTRAAALFHRLSAIVGAILRLSQFSKVVASADLIVARNIETLAVATILRRCYAPNLRIVYECLDIHRAMLSPPVRSAIMRAAERALMNRCAALITSSPAFVRNYFGPYQRATLQVLLVENRVLRLNSVGEKPLYSPAQSDGRVWRISWSGILRCRRSLEILCKLAAELDGRVEVILRGRPALHEFGNFFETVTSAPYVTFDGAYTSPEEAYRDVDFAWALDFFEEGMNSSWLLPNRIYESGVVGVIPIADARVETGRFLDTLSVGVLLKEEPIEDDLVQFFRELTIVRWKRLAQAIRNVPVSTWIATKDDCLDLVLKLRELAR